MLLIASLITCISTAIIPKPWWWPFVFEESTLCRCSACGFWVWYLSVESSSRILCCQNHWHPVTLKSRWRYPHRGRQYCRVLPRDHRVLSTISICPANCHRSKRTMKEDDTDDVQSETNTSHNQHEHRILYSWVTSARFYKKLGVVLCSVTKRSTDCRKMLTLRATRKVPLKKASRSEPLCQPNDSASGEFSRSDIRARMISWWIWWWRLVSYLECRKSYNKSHQIIQLWERGQKPCIIIYLMETYIVKSVSYQSKRVGVKSNSKWVSQAPTWLFLSRIDEPEISAAKKKNEMLIAMDNRCVLERPWIMVGNIHLA